MQTYRFSWVFDLTDAEVFQGNDPSWFLILLVEHIHSRVTATVTATERLLFVFYVCDQSQQELESSRINRQSTNVCIIYAKN